MTILGVWASSLVLAWLMSKWTTRFGRWPAIGATLLVAGLGAKTAIEVALGLIP